ncbi:MAG TPA: hypothetical protein VLF91_02755 [Candidatus Saccharimonadales bacterium]|nr:hypothetical protein [Candidatus Saccharimonadales bacterium]
MSLHEQIASDEYWDAPPAIHPVYVSFGAQVFDELAGDGVPRRIDEAYRNILAHSSVHIKQIGRGELLALDAPGGLLKVVEDMRTFPKKPSRRRTFVEPEIFDEQAQDMVDALLYAGPQAGTKLEGPDGLLINIARRVVYLRNSPSGRQLVGKNSSLLGRGGGRYDKVYIPHHPVGHIHTRETRRDRIQTRVVSAEVILPSGARRPSKAVLDLGWIGLSPRDRLALPGAI